MDWASAMKMLIDKRLSAVSIYILCLIGPEIFIRAMTSHIHFNFAHWPVVCVVRCAVCVDCWYGWGLVEGAVVILARAGLDNWNVSTDIKITLEIGYLELPLASPDPSEEVDDGHRDSEGQAYQAECHDGVTADATFLKYRIDNKWGN